MLLRLSYQALLYLDLFVPRVTGSRAGSGFIALIGERRVGGTVVAVLTVFVIATGFAPRLSGPGGLSVCFSRRSEIFVFRSAVGIR